MSQKNKIQEVQILENNLQNILLQKQVFQMELSETQSALNYVNQSKEDIFKIVGQLMIKTDKSKVKEELSNKEKMLELRIKSLEKQENSIEDRLQKLKEEILDSKNSK